MKRFPFLQRLCTQCAAIAAIEQIDSYLMYHYSYNKALVSFLHQEAQSLEYRNRIERYTLIGKRWRLPQERAGNSVLSTLMEASLIRLCQSSA